MQKSTSKGIASKSVVYY